MNEHSAVVAKRSDEFSKNYRLTECIFGSIVRWGDRWLTDEGEPVVEATFDLSE
jgi:hypothetical protein